MIRLVKFAAFIVFVAIVGFGIYFSEKSKPNAYTGGYLDYYCIEGIRYMSKAMNGGLTPMYNEKGKIKTCEAFNE